MRYSAEQFQKKLTHWARIAPKELKKAMDIGGLDIQKDVQKNRLLGQVLQRRSGTLQRSIDFKSNISGKRITLQVGTKVPYGKYWEEGFTRGSVKVKARPFLKPAIAAKKNKVISRIADAMMGAYKKA